MTSEILIESIKKDFESFFMSAYEIKIEHSNLPNLSVKGTRNETRILIPDDFLNMQIDREEDKFYTLFLLGHEIAHYVNKHNEHSDTSDGDSLSLEMWADFFGSLISMSILKFGENFESCLACDRNDFDETLKYIFSSFEKLYTIFKNTDSSSQYPSSNDRLRSVFTGVLSFLVRVDMTFNVNPIPLDEYYLQSSRKWLLKMFNLIDKESNLYNVLGMNNELNTAEIHEKTKKIHQQLMENENQITEGINPLLRWIIGTDFNRPDYMNKAREYLMLNNDT